MTDPSLQRALLATARLAGLAGLVACGPRGVIVTEHPAETGDTALAAEPVCEDLLPALVADFTADWQLEVVDDDTRACCATFVDDVNETGAYPSDDAGLNTLSACCTALDHPVGLACTPWGPPAPPAMRAIA